MLRQRSPRAKARSGSSDADWHKDALIYELHVRAFQDSDADGIGDFPGLTSRLGYLQDLGVTALWLLPFYPSPLRDDGYDIADYTAVHPSYGDLDDVRRFLDEAHRRGLRVITELVVNHTSDQHPWFQRARTAAPGSAERDFYVWSESPDRFQGARVIFNDTERSNWTWDPIAQAYFWHRFYSHQPDLNFDHPAVLDAVAGVIDFWFGLGVDGMRLDAVPYLVEREGTHSENLRPTHDILKALRRHVDERFTGRMFLAEANQWPEDAVAYFGDGDESHMVFHFPLMPRLFMAIRQEDRLPVIDILAQTPAPPPGGQWALFLRNHDELTLEMVTEEERQYMWHVFATDPQARLNLGIRRRLAPLVNNDRRRIELLNMLLFSLPGTPIVYYGDEIGMGDNIYLGDRNGVRTPMQWSAERNAGFSKANPQRLFLPLIVDDQYHFAAVHVEQQTANPSSLLSWTKRLIALRRRYQAFGRGSMELVDVASTQVLAYVRRWKQQQVLVIANLSRFVQHVQLQLGAWAGHVPIELFGRSRFPGITEEPYAITLSPHACHWFELQPAGRVVSSARPVLSFQRNWDEVLEGRTRADLESALVRYVEQRAALVSGARVVLSVRVQDALRVSRGFRTYVLLVVHVTFTTGEPLQYLLVLGCRAPTGKRQRDANAIATLRRLMPSPREYELYDASEDQPLGSELFACARQHRHLESLSGRLEFTTHSEADIPAGLRSSRRLRRGRQGTNALVPVGRDIVLKLLRRLEVGPSPEVEIGTWLNRMRFPHAPIVFGSLQYRPRAPRGTGNIAVGVFQQRIENDGEAWDRAVGAAETFYQRGVIEPYLQTVRLMARRTADLHRALGTSTADPAFAPELLGHLSRRSTYQRMRTLAVSVTMKLRAQQATLARELQQPAQALTSLQSEALEIFHHIIERPVMGPRIRCHGNLHLGQILHAGDDLVFIDFEGEPGRPLYERRLKRSPLQDVATMIRSFHYAGHAPLMSRAGSRVGDRAADRRAVWQEQVSAVFLDEYVAAMDGSGLLPAAPEERSILLNAILLERAYYELGFELNHRPAWLRAPLLDIPAIITASRAAMD